ncbi:MAG: hypothetical protein OEV55_07590 [candidate division Zixibacteria bacterium]|nr:hypothetical protein [candidate division Zixibacteria bacterium]
MLWENFEKLEQKINKVLELVDRLKEESKQTGSSYSTVSARIYELDEKTKALEKENNNLRAQIKIKEDSIKSKEDKIRRKIENLLTLLKDVE